MLVQFGTSGFAGHCLYLGDREQKFLGTVSHLIALFEWDARQRTDVDGEWTFIEWREERASQREEESQGNDEQPDGASQGQAFMN